MKGLFTAIIVLCGLVSPVNRALAQTWIKTSAPSNVWTSVSSSADGTKLAAVSHQTIYGAGGVYVSTNSGGVWTLTSAPQTNGWVSVASSADGTKLVALSFEGIYVSGDSGASWIMTTNPFVYWHTVACSADGTKCIAAGGSRGTTGLYNYISTNSGMTWQPTYDPSAEWLAAASSADGTILAAAGGPMYVSTNSGATWTQPNALNANWYSIASSADGTKLVVVGVPGVYISDDTGTTWTKTEDSTDIIFGSVASSADGTKLVITPDNFHRVNGPIYTSTNSGVTWTSNNTPIIYWGPVASSADGCKLVAAVVGGGIYTCQIASAPKLNLIPASTNFALSWILPSTNFVLQQNCDLTTTNWMTLPTAPTLNLTNLQDEVYFCPSNSSGFYRLATP